MFSIQTLNKISSKGLDLFPRDLYDVTAEASTPDAIVVRSHKMHEMAFPTSLRAIARAGAGVNNIPLERCSKQGIVVFNTPGANANSVKELVIAGMLLASRRIVEGIAWARSLADRGDAVPGLVEKGKKQFAGPEIKGKKLGVIGLGAIGVAVANDAAALGMEVIGYDPFISVDAAWGLSRDVQRADSLSVLLAESDYVTLHVPLNDNTRDLIDGEKLAAMKPGARLLNFARGELVHQAALMHALNEGPLAVYVTDFPNEEMVRHEQVLPVPHLGASTPEAEDNCAIMAVRQVRDFLEQGNITNSVNFPACQMPKPPEDYRIVLANKNEPNMIGQVATVLAEHGINIADLLNRHRDNLAYNIIDVDTRVDEGVLARLRAIQGVIMVRTLTPISAEHPVM